jgi:hypothetical protein
MGTVGNRLLFHEKRETSDIDTIVDEVLNGTNYSERVQRCNEVVTTFLRQLWDNTGGVGGVKFTNSAGHVVRSALGTLTQIICFGRATINNDGVVEKESPKRVLTTLSDISKGRAVLNGRRRVTLEDLEMAGRIALSTIPKKRRPLIRMLLDPDQGGVLTASDVEALTGVSRPTAHSRMDTLETLGIAAVTESEDDGRHPKRIELNDTFRWPEESEFPVF